MPPWAAHNFKPPALPEVSDLAWQEKGVSRLAKVAHEAEKVARRPIPVARQVKNVAAK